MNALLLLRLHQWQWLPIKSTCLFLFIWQPTSAQLQWSFQYDAPTGFFLEDVVVGEADTNLILFTGSSQYRTSNDNGRSWYGLGSGGFSVKAAHFPSKEFGIVVGNDGNYRINDDCGYFWGWNNTTATGLGEQLLDVHFSNAQQGYTCGENGALAYTPDQANTWQQITTNTTAHLNGVFSPNDSITFVCGDSGTVLQLLNSTVQNIQILNTNINLRKLTFVSDSVGFIVGDSGTIYRTIDQGANWNLLPIATTITLHNLDFYNPQHGIVCGDSTQIWATQDGGNTWTRSFVPNQLDDEVRAVAFKNNAIGYAVGRQFTLYSNDGGHTWTRYDGDLQNIDFPTSERGYAVGYFGAAHRTLDGGATWEPMFINTSQYFNDLFFLNQDTGYVVGGAEVWRTHDGGTTWQSIPNPATTSLGSVYFTDYNHGVVVGYHGSIMTTSDAGMTWQWSTNASNQWYLNLKFTNATTGYFTTQNGGIRKTTDGGMTWTATPTGNSQWLGDLFFLNDSIGWSVGGNGTIIHTQDAGSSWTLQTSGVTKYLNGIFFLNRDTGVAMGEDGTFLTSFDGGTTWQNRSIGNNTADYTDVVFTQKGIGFATAPSAIYVLEPFYNTFLNNIFCPGDQIGINCHRPFFDNQDSVTVVYEITAQNDDFTNAIPLDTTTFDSAATIIGHIPENFGFGVYKTRLRQIDDATKVSLPKSIKVVDQPTISVTFADPYLIATTSQPATIAWWRQDSTFVYWVGNGDSLLVSDPANYQAYATAACCEVLSDFVTLVDCNGQLTPANHQQSLSICAGSSITIGQHTYTQAGTFLDTLQTGMGCDSILTTYLSLLPKDSAVQSFTLCYGDSLQVGNTIHNASGLYQDTLTNQSGCDSIVTTNLTILPFDSTHQSFTLCYGASVWIVDSLYQTPGTFIHSFTNAQGCDSVLYSHVTVLPPDSVVTHDTICFGDTLQVGPSFYYQAGAYIDTFVDQQDCIHIHYTNLTVMDQDTVTQQLTICPGDFVQVGTHTYNTAGTYQDTLANGIGCDSIVTTHLSLHVLPQVNLGPDTILCTTDNFQLDAGPGHQSYAWNTGATTQTISVNTSGQYTVTVESAKGCLNSDTVEVLFDNCDGIGLNITEELRIYPNPTTGLLTIESPQAPLVIEVYNTLGISIYGPSEINQRTNIHLPDAGVYFVISYREGNDRKTPLGVTKIVVMGE